MILPPQLVQPGMLPPADNVAAATVGATSQTSGFSDIFELFQRPGAPAEPAEPLSTVGQRSSTEAQHAIRFEQELPVGKDLPQFGTADVAAPASDTAQKPAAPISALAPELPSPAFEFSYADPVESPLEAVDDTSLPADYRIDVDAPAASEPSQNTPETGAQSMASQSQPEDALAKAVNAASVDTTAQYRGTSRLPVGIHAAATVPVNPEINAAGRATTVAPAPVADNPRLPGNGLTAAKLADGEMHGNIPSPQKQTARGHEQPLAPRLAPSEALYLAREEFSMRSDALARYHGEAKPILSSAAVQLDHLLRAPGAALTTSGEIDPTLQTLSSKAANTPVIAAPLPTAPSANRENVARYDVYARMTPETQMSIAAESLPISTRPTQENVAGTVSPQPVPVNTFSHVAVESQVHGDSQQSPAKQSLTVSQQVALAQINKVDDPLAQQVLRGLTAQRLQDGVVRIQLTPANLGHIDVRIQHADQQDVQISMLVREGQTRELLEQVAPKIRANLSQMGVEVGDLDIRQGRKDDSERRQYTPPVVDPSSELDAVDQPASPIEHLAKQFAREGRFYTAV